MSGTLSTTFNVCNWRKMYFELADRLSSVFEAVTKYYRKNVFVASLLLPEIEKNSTGGDLSSVNLFAENVRVILPIVGPSVESEWINAFEIDCVPIISR